MFVYCHRPKSFQCPGDPCFILHCLRYCQTRSIHSASEIVVTLPMREPCERGQRRDGSISAREEVYWVRTFVAWPHVAIAQQHLQPCTSFGVISTHLPEGAERSGKP